MPSTVSKKEALMSDSLSGQCVPLWDLTSPEGRGKGDVASVQLLTFEELFGHCDLKSAKP